MRRRIGSSSSSDSPSMLMPKARTSPESGRMSPATCRSSTVLPEPLPPMTTSVSPLPRRDDTPRSTSARSNDLRSSTTSTTGEAIAHQKSMRKILVRKKSDTITAIVTCTTVAVVARPSPSVPPVVDSPL